MLKFPFINIGTSKGVSVKNIVDFLLIHGKTIKYTTLEREELKVSTSDNSILKERLGKVNFKDIEDYLREQLLWKKW